MNKKFIFFIFILLLNNCSFDTKSKLWTKSENIKKEKISKVKDIFIEKEILEKEFNSNIKIKLKSKFTKDSFINNLTNNNGYLNFGGDLKKISKYKFSKIKEYDFSQPELLFTEDNSLIFFDNKGSILKFDENSKLIWKKNYYKKNEKKLNPILYFTANKEKLIVVDNLANMYAIDIFSGNLIWKRSNVAPFNSQIKIYDSMFFSIDFNNVIRCISIENGKEIWKFVTENSFIKSQQKLSLIIKDNKVIFMNSLGDISALEMQTGSLIWQTPTQSTSVYEDAFSLKNSDIVFKNNSIYFSNNKNEFYALDFKTGSIKWKQNVNSNLRPTIIEKLIFTISEEGYLIIIDSINGGIIRSTSLFKNYKKLNNSKFKTVGFIVAKEKIYLSLDNGYILKIKIENGKTEDLIKIAKNKISRPYIANQNMYIVRNNAILKIN